MAASVKYEYAVNRIFQIAVRDEVVNSLPSGGERSGILLGGGFIYRVARRSVLAILTFFKAKSSIL